MILEYKNERYEANPIRYGDVPKYWRKLGLARREKETNYGSNIATVYDSPKLGLCYAIFVDGNFYEHLGTLVKI